MFLILLIIAFVALVGWIVYSAGPKFALKRFGGALLVLVLVTFAVSSLLSFTSGEESTRQALEELGVSRNAQPCVTALGTGAGVEEVNACVEDRGLDKNLVSQYLSWSKQIVVDRDLGFAFYKNQEKLSDTMRQRLPRTAWLFLYSQLTALFLAVPLGIWSAYQASRPRAAVTPSKVVGASGVALVLGLLFSTGPLIALPAAVLAILATVFAARLDMELPFKSWILPAVLAAIVVVGTLGGWRLTTLFAAVVAAAALLSILAGGRLADNNTNFLAFALLSIPVFVMGETLRYAFAIERNVYQLTGYQPWSSGAFEHAKSIWLPTLVLGMAATPVYLRLLRADMIQNLQQDFVSVAKAKGMSNTHILLRHVLRPSTVTLITVLGLNIAQLVNGAIVVEFIYDLDGMGSYLIQAFARREFFAVQTIVALVAALFILTNTVIDVLYTAVDPRVKADADK